MTKLECNEKEIAQKCGITLDILRKLKKQTLDAKNKSYSPYSHFKVGCCLLITSNDTDDTNNATAFLQGTNVENASYGNAICAERSAIVSAISQGYSKSNGYKFKCIAIVADTTENDFITPCGICRQVIREFCNDTTKIIMFNYDCTICCLKTINDLLPLSFGPEYL
ncbi:cytidine deaminase SCDLUD_001862 [Saccharomycodes ludwigii]|uniref:cytidine deaminase n=1 Tax=Saccharomycodes ludwigii TaxID=36035 RepID=UPI001E875D51|nr:hypothetical protein SCDLUD_001862 [Saccharomycodes ludwigii]KAH3902051.1 hypothetical protein SCDLUD_001862 [Saccharomycodes ludwigii]